MEYEFEEEPHRPRVASGLPKSGDQDRGGVEMEFPQRSSTACCVVPFVGRGTSNDSDLRIASSYSPKQRARYVCILLHEINEEMVKKDFVGSGPYPTYILQSTTKTMLPSDWQTICPGPTTQDQSDGEGDVPVSGVGVEC
jgi:hypothetical protein